MKKFFKNILCTIVLICATMPLFACSTQYLSTDRNEMWKKDIDYLKTALNNKHLNLYFAISQNEFNSEIDNLKNSVDSMNDEEIIDGIYKITASIKDPHTKAYINYSDRFPVNFYIFSEGMYLIDTTEDYKDALNLKIKSIDGNDLNTIKEKLTCLIADCNDANVKKTIPSLLARPDILYGCHIINSKDSAEFIFENDKKEEIKMDVKAQSDFDFIYGDEKDETYPLYMRNSKLAYWYQYIEDKNVLYFKYNDCTKHGESVNIDDMINDMLKIIDQNKGIKFVLDMRDNGGGSPSVIRNLINGIEEREVNNSSQFFVVIGRRTFSAAIINADTLKKETNAVFIGENTSGSPNHYGEITQFKLPNSKMGITCSTKYSKISDDNSDTFKPDIVMEPSVYDYINKKDPILDYIENN